MMRNVKLPTKIESQLLKLGKAFDFGRKFSASSEFRELTPDDLSMAMKIIEDNSI